MNKYSTYMLCYIYCMIKYCCFLITKAERYINLTKIIKNLEIDVRIKQFKSISSSYLGYQRYLS